VFFGRFERKFLPDRRPFKRLCCRAREMLRQIKCECAATAGRASELDLATEQSRQLAADCKAEASTAIFAARAGVGLLVEPTSMQRRKAGSMPAAT